MHMRSRNLGQEIINLFTTSPRTFTYTITVDVDGKPEKSKIVSTGPLSTEDLDAITQDRREEIVKSTRAERFLKTIASYCAAVARENEKAQVVLIKDIAGEISAAAGKDWAEATVEDNELTARAVNSVVQDLSPYLAPHITSEPASKLKQLLERNGFRPSAATRHVSSLRSTAISSLEATLMVTAAAPQDSRLAVLSAMDADTRLQELYGHAQRQKMSAGTFSRFVIKTEGAVTEQGNDIREGIASIPTEEKYDKNREYFIVHPRMLAQPVFGDTLLRYALTYPHTHLVAEKHRNARKKHADHTEQQQQILGAAADHPPLETLKKRIENIMKGTPGKITRAESTPWHTSILRELSPDEQTTFNTAYERLSRQRAQLRELYENGNLALFLTEYATKQGDPEFLKTIQNPDSFKAYLSSLAQSTHTNALQSETHTQETISDRERPQANRFILIGDHIRTSDLETMRDLVQQSIVHYTTDKARDAAQAARDGDVLIVMKKQTSHPASNILRRAARTAGIPIEIVSATNPERVALEVMAKYQQ